MLVIKHSPGSSPRIVNSNLLFTEVSGYQRSELFDKEVNMIAPRLFREEGADFLSFG